MLSRGEIPATWSEIYPGLREVNSLWLQALRSFVSGTFMSDADTSKRASSPTDRALTAMHQVGDLWSWLSLFGLTAVGPAEDWPERLEFHQIHAGLVNYDHGTRMPPLSRLNVIFIGECPIIPRSPPIEQLAFSMLSPNWSHYGQKITDVLSCLQLEAEYSDDETMESIDQVIEADDNVVCSSESPQSIVGLWPLVILTALRSRQMQTNLSIRSASRIILTMLTRPLLLTFISSVQSCARPVPAQQQAFRISSIQTPDDQSIEKFCARVDLPATQRVLPPVRLNTLDLVSFSSKLFSLTSSLFCYSSSLALGLLRLVEIL